MIRDCPSALSLRATTGRFARVGLLALVAVLPCLPWDARSDAQAGEPEPDPLARERLLARLSSPSPTQREAAAYLLGECSSLEYHERAALRYAIRHDVEAYVRREALLALAKHVEGKELEIDVTVGASDSAATVRLAALEVAANEVRADRTAVRWVIQAALADRDHSVQLRALELVPTALLSWSEVKAQVIPLARSPRSAIRAGVCHCIAAIGSGSSSSALPVLLSGLRDDSSEVRDSAISALGQLRWADEEDTRRSLVACLSDRREWVRRTALHGLVEFDISDHAAIVRAIALILEAPSLEEAGLAARYAERCTPILSHLLVDALRRADTPSRRALVLHVIAEVGWPKDRVPRDRMRELCDALIAEASGPAMNDDLFAISAAKALAGLRSCAMPARDVLLRLYRKPCRWITFAGALPDFVPPDRRRRAEAVRALLLIGDHGAATVGAVEDALADEHWFVRLTTAQTLAEWSELPAGVAAGLERVAEEDSNASARLAATETLRKFAE